MAGWVARRLCPDIEFVGGHFRDYQRLADQVMEVFYDFTPLVERISIDEAFLDVAGAGHLFGPPGRIAAAIRRRVRAEIGLPVSVGVARTKHLAKVASRVAKPDGVVEVDPASEREFLAPLPVGLIWGVGPVTEARLAGRGIRTIGDLNRVSSPILQQLLGVASGTKLASLSANIDPRAIESPRAAKSIGAQAALGARPATRALLGETIGYLMDRVSGRLRGGHRAARTVTVRVRFTGLRSVTRSVTVAAPISATLSLTEIALRLASDALADHPAESQITLLGVSLSNLAEEPALQLELPFNMGADRHRPGISDDRLRPDIAADQLRPGSPVGSSRWGVDRSVDAIRARFGRAAIGYATVVLSTADRVPEEFRELAEHSDP
jgi:DNA polymerase-4